MKKAISKRRLVFNLLYLFILGLFLCIFIELFIYQVEFNLHFIIIGIILLILSVFIILFTDLTEIGITTFVFGEIFIDIVIFSLIGIR